MRLCLLLLLISLFLPQVVLAQTPANTLTVSPSIVRLDLASDEPQTTLVYTNTSDKPIELRFSASDFAELEHGYKPDFLEEKNAQNYEYSLSSWITFGQQSIVIKPYSTEKVTVFINKERLSPGGHYGSILATIINNPTDEQVAIQGALSSLIFVRTATGSEKESGKIATLSPEQAWIDFPKRFVLRFQNTSNTDVIPYGLVEIKDMLGRTVAKGILNEGSLISLPESIRRYDIELTQNESILLPGRYHATFTGHFGKTRQAMETETTFWSEGSFPLIPLTIAIIIMTVFVVLNKRNKRS